MAVNSIAKTDEPVFNHPQSRLIALNGMVFEHNVMDASEDVIRRTLEDVVFTALDVDLRRSTLVSPCRSRILGSVVLSTILRTGAVE